MTKFTASKLKEARKTANMTQNEVANALGMSVRRVKSCEIGEQTLTVDNLLEFAKLYKVDVRELLLEEYSETNEEQILCNRYISLLRLFDQLSDRDKEDVIWVIKQRVDGYI